VSKPVGFTGLKIEAHAILVDEKVCVVYMNDERVATLYFKPTERLVKFLYEPNLIRLRVDRRIPGTLDFDSDVLRETEVFFRKWLFDRFIIVNADGLAWSGSCWVPKGGDVQICNFDTEQEARDYWERKP